MLISRLFCFSYEISPQLRARLRMREQPREDLPWNEWRTGRRRSNSFPDASEGETSGGENTNQRELHHDDIRGDTSTDPRINDSRGDTRDDARVAWNENKRPRSAWHGNHRMTFTEWLDSKEALERSRPSSARARNEHDKDDISHERQTAKSYEEWLRRKDQEALEKEEMLRKKAKKKFHRTYKRK